MLLKLPGQSLIVAIWTGQHFKAGNLVPAVIGILIACLILLGVFVLVVELIERFTGGRRNVG
jgi:hypothetical protein